MDVYDQTPILEGARDEEDTIRFLVATDNHIGYKEQDQVRGDDPIRTFEEIILLAKRHKVDALVLGGDLFHDNKPSRKSMYNVMTLLRKHCLGDEACALEFLSDPKVNFADTFDTVNYMDPNINVSLPVFTIHGNHDDPTGAGNLTAIDILSVTGLLNHFGKTRDVEDIRMAPVLLRKGRTHLSMYGLGAIRDERLHRAFVQEQVRLFRPLDGDTEEGFEGWFNLCLLHQNRAAHGLTNHIPEHFIDGCMDLIIWGHEHECRIVPEWNAQRDFYVSQPGSSVATSLSEGEAKSKHVGLVEIKGRRFRQKNIPLRTVRPFRMDSIILSEHLGSKVHDTRGVEELLRRKVESMIAAAEREWREERAGGETGEEDPVPDPSYIDRSNKRSPSTWTPGEFPLPLIRLRVDYNGGFSSFNPRRFGQEFVGKVANPREILHFHRRRQTVALGASSSAPRGAQTSLLEAMKGPGRLENFRVEDLVAEYLEEAQTTFSLLSLAGMDDAVRTFVDKEEGDSIRVFREESLQQAREYVAIGSQSARANSGAGTLTGREEEAEEEGEIMSAFQQAQRAATMRRRESQGSGEAGTGRIVRGYGGRAEGETPTRILADARDDDDFSPALKKRGAKAMGKIDGVRGRGKKVEVNAEDVQDDSDDDDEVVIKETKKSKRGVSSTPSSSQLTQRRLPFGSASRSKRS